jgi:hypothetical protein
MPGKLRVLFTIGSLAGGGAERQTLLYLRHLDRRRFEPLLYLTYRQGELLDQVPDDVPVLAFWDRHRFPRWNVPGRIHRWQVRDLARVLVEREIDVLVSVTFLATLVAGSAVAAASYSLAGRRNGRSAPRLGQRNQAVPLAQTPASDSRLSPGGPDGRRLGRSPRGPDGDVRAARRTLGCPAQFHRRGRSRPARRPAGAGTRSRPIPSDRRRAFESAKRSSGSVAGHDPTGSPNNSTTCTCTCSAKDRWKPNSASSSIVTSCGTT